MRGDCAEPNRRADVAAQCDGKNKLTFDQAAKIEARDSGKERGIKAYKCRICRQWHVGQAGPLKKRQ